jgi:hypothetical protein
MAGRLNSALVKLGVPSVAVIATLLYWPIGQGGWGPSRDTPIAFAMHGYGQSNMEGSAGGALPYSTTNGSPTAPPFYNLEYRTSAFAPAYSNTGAANTQEVCFSLLDQLATWYVGSNGRTRVRGACQEAAVGSQTYAQLADGTGNWTTQWNEARALRNGYAAAFPEVAGAAPLNMVVWLQGESNHTTGTSRATYRANLDTLWQDICDEFSAAPWSASSCPQIYLIPFASQTRLGSPSTATYSDRSEIPLAHYEACRDAPARFVCAHQGYASALTVTNEHYSERGYLQNGAQLARVARRRLIEGTDWRMLRPDPAAITCTGNVVTVPLVGGVDGGLVIDTTLVARRPHYGFEYSDNGTDPATIRGVRVVGSSVELTLTRACTTGGVVQYATTGGPACSAGRTGVCPSGGNIRRASCDVPYWGGPEQLCDWLTTFEEPVVSVTNTTPDIARPHVDVGVAARAPSGTSWWQARSSDATDGAANMSVSAWVRTPAAWAADQVVVERYGAAGARHWSLRLGTPGRMTIYLSADGTAISQVCHTPDNVLTASTFHHLAFTKSGTTLTPYVDGTATTCAGTGSSGTTPATLSNGRSSPYTVGGSGAVGGNNLPVAISHVGVWARALSGAEVTSLRTTTPIAQPADPRPLAPSHYWPYQSSGDDLGTASVRPAIAYGGAALVEHASLFAASDSYYACGSSAVLDGATSATLRVDVTMPAAALPQEGTVVERDDATSTGRQLGVSINTSGQLIVRVAAAASGTGQWPADAGRAQCTTVGALAASTRYRLLVRYDGTQGTNATRLRVWRATVSTADADSLGYASLSNITEETCTFLGTIPATLTTPGAAPWSVGRRAAALNQNGLRNAQLNGNGVVLWAGRAAEAVTVVPEVLRAVNVYDAPLGQPSLVWRFRGPQVVETQTLGACTLTGATPAVAYVAPGEPTTPAARSYYPISFINTLSEPGRTLLGAATSAGSAPFRLSPSGSSWVATGINIITYVNGSFPVTSAAPPERVRLVSDTNPLGTAGFFTSQTTTNTPPRAFSPPAGFVVEACNAQSPNTLGVRGTILALASDFGALFNPRGLVDLVGWVHDPTDAVASGWWWCVDATCTALGAAAPRDGRMYCGLIAVPAGACSVGTPCTGYALLVDMLAPDGPRIADQRSWTLDDTTSRFLEVNSSCCEVSGVARTMDVATINGTRQYSP